MPMDELISNLYGGMDIDTDYCEAQIHSFEEVEFCEYQPFCITNDTVSQVLVAAAKEMWLSSKLEKYLTEAGLDEGCIRIFVAFWTNEKEKIKSQLLGKCTWNNHFGKVSWRVDVKTASKATADLGEPVALVELSNVAQVSNMNCNSVGKFAMNREEMGDFLQTLENIQKKITDESS